MSTYIYKDNQQVGPLEDSQILAKLTDGSLSYDDMAWRAGWKDWQPISTIFSPPLTKKTRSPSQKIDIKPCPSCGEDILEVASKCKHCGSNLSQANEDPIGSGCLSVGLGGCQVLFYILMGILGLIILGLITWR